MDVSLPFLIRAEMSPIRQDSGRALSGSSPSTIRVPGQIQPIRGKRSDAVARAVRCRNATCSDDFAILVTTRATVRDGRDRVCAWLAVGPAAISGAKGKIHAPERRGIGPAPSGGRARSAAIGPASTRYDGRCR
jgi:hypothetical protein